MKSRTGFVSNSSSTSFCIIGVDAYGGYDRDEENEERNIIIRTLVALDSIDPDEIEWGVSKGKLLDFFGSEGEIYKIGMWADKLLQIMTIPEAKVYFVAAIRDEYGVLIPLEYVEFLYGESGSG